MTVQTTAADADLVTLSDAACRLSMVPTSLFNKLIRKGLGSQIRTLGSRRAIPASLVAELEAEQRQVAA